MISLIFCSCLLFEFVLLTVFNISYIIYFNFLRVSFYYIALKLYKNNFPKKSKENDMKNSLFQIKNDDEVEIKKKHDNLTIFFEKIISYL
jgi:hypothetical protein